MLKVANLVQIATVELGRKSLRDIQVETAYTWAGRAVAAAKLGRLPDAHEYWHEAQEHAALAGIAVFEQIRSEVSQLVPMGTIE